MLKDYSILILKIQRKIQRFLIKTNVLKKDIHKIQKEFISIIYNGNHKRGTYMKNKWITFKLLIVIALILGGYYFFIFNPNHIEEYTIENLEIQHKFLTVNPYSRSGLTLKRVNGVVVHYTANPGSSAINNRNYFESLKTTKKTKASSHFIIGINGEIIQCIPLNEISYASNNRNRDTISIECCHPDSTGRFTNATYQSLQKLVKALMITYSLDKNDIIRHYDVTGKEFPKYYVKYPQKWQEFLDSLE